MFQGLAQSQSCCLYASQEIDLIISFLNNCQIVKAFCFGSLILVWKRPKSYVYMKLHSLWRGRPRPKTRGLVIIKHHSEKGKHRSLNVKQEDLWNRI